MRLKKNIKNNFDAVTENIYPLKKYKKYKCILLKEYFKEFRDFHKFFKGWYSVFFLKNLNICGVHRIVQI